MAETRDGSAQIKERNRIDLGCEFIKWKELHNVKSCLLIGRYVTCVLYFREHTLSRVMQAVRSKALSTSWLQE